jgi:hypothetical protein
MFPIFVKSLKKRGYLVGFGFSQEDAQAFAMPNPGEGVPDLAAKPKTIIKKISVPRVLVLTEDNAFGIGAVQDIIPLTDEAAEELKKFEISDAIRATLRLEAVQQAIQQGKELDEDHPPEKGHGADCTGDTCSSDCQCGTCPPMPEGVEEIPPIEECESGCEGEGEGCESCPEAKD